MVSPFRALEEYIWATVRSRMKKPETLKRTKNARQMRSQEERGEPGKMDNWAGDSIRVRQERG